MAYPEAWFRAPLKAETRPEALKKVREGCSYFPISMAWLATLLYPRRSAWVLDPTGFTCIIN
jgi:hypothetical protein